MEAREWEQIEERVAAAEHKLSARAMRWRIRQLCRIRYGSRRRRNTSM